MVLTQRRQGRMPSAPTASLRGAYDIHKLNPDPDKPGLTFDP
jgi:hypothetical protein